MTIDNTNLQSINTAIGNVNLERTLLGQILADNDIMTETLAILNSKDFIDKRHQIIFSVMSQLHKAEARIEPDTINQRLGLADRDIVGISYINDITYEIDSSKFSYYAKTIKELSNRRVSVEKLQQSIRDLQDVTKPFESTVNNAINFMVAKENSSNEAKDFIDVYYKAKERIYEMKASGKLVKGMECGIKDLDHYLNGFEKKKLHIIGAEPRRGKTTFLVSILKGLAKNHYTYFFSMEQEDVEAMLKSMSADTGILNEKVSIGTTLTDDELKKLDDLEEKYKQLNLRINDKASLTMAQLRSAVMREKQTKGIDVVAIDYLGIMNREKQKGETDSVALGRITRGLQYIAKDFDVAVILLCQLNRLEPGKRPILSNLRDSGEIEACGDKVMLLYAPEENENILEVILAKNKGGRECSVNLFFDKSIQRVKSFIRDDDEVDNVEKYKEELRQKKLKEQQKLAKQKEEEESPIPDVDEVEYNRMVDNEDIPEDVLLAEAMKNFGDLED